MKINTNFITKYVLVLVFRCIVLIKQCFVLCFASNQSWFILSQEIRLEQLPAGCYSEVILLTLNMSLSFCIVLYFVASWLIGFNCFYKILCGIAFWARRRKGYVIFLKFFYFLSPIYSNLFRIKRKVFYQMWRKLVQCKLVVLVKYSLATMLLLTCFTYLCAKNSKLHLFIL